MYKTITLYDFKNEFKLYGRDNQFSPRALEILFAYLTEYEDDTLSPQELDVIAICCDFTELEPDQAKKELGLEDFDELYQKTIAWDLKETWLWQNY